MIRIICGFSIFDLKLKFQTLMKDLLSSLQAASMLIKFVERHLILVKPMKVFFSIIPLLLIGINLSAQTEVFPDPKTPENNVNALTIEMNPSWLKCVDDIDCTLVQSSCKKWLPVATESVTDYNGYLSKTKEDCTQVLEDYTKPEVKCVDQICRADGTPESPTKEMLN